MSDEDLLNLGRLIDTLVKAYGNCHVTLDNGRLTVSTKFGDSRRSRT